MRVHMAWDKWHPSARRMVAEFAGIRASDVPEVVRTPWSDMEPWVRRLLRAACAEIYRRYMKQATASERNPKQSRAEQDAIEEAYGRMGIEAMAGKGGFWRRGKGWVSLRHARKETGIDMSVKRGPRMEALPWGDYATVAAISGWRRKKKNPYPTASVIRVLQRLGSAPLERGHREAPVASLRLAKQTASYLKTHGFRPMIVAPRRGDVEIVLPETGVKVYRNQAEAGRKLFEGIPGMTIREAIARNFIVPEKTFGRSGDERIIGYRAASSDSRLFTSARKAYEYELEIRVKRSAAEEAAKTPHQRKMESLWASLSDLQRRKARDHAFDEDVGGVLEASWKLYSKRFN